MADDSNSKIGDDTATKSVGKEKSSEGKDNNAVNPKTNGSTNDSENPKQGKDSKGFKDKLGEDEKKTQPTAKCFNEKSKGDGSGDIRMKAKPKKTSGLCSIYLYILFPFSIVLLAVFARDYIPEEMRPEYLNLGKAEDKYDYPKIFENRIQIIKHLFPNQTERFWKILKNKGLAHLKEKNPKQPLVILLGAPPSAHAVLDCLAQKLAWCLDPDFKQSNVIDGGKYNKIDGHKAKEILDEKLENVFSKDTDVRSAVVLHLELLPPPSPNLFYKYCDGDNSPYKNAGIIFTVSLPKETDPSLTAVKAEGSIESYLGKVVWANYPNDDDAISALLTRIGDTAALVNSETEEVVQSGCSA